MADALTRTSEAPRASIRRPTVEEVRLKEYLSVEDVSVLLAVSPNTVRAWRRDRKLPPALKFGKLVRWKRDTIEQWVREQLESL